jgi:hypothetical protein
MSQLLCTEQNALAHDLSGLELDRSSGGNGHIDIREIRITANAGTGQTDLEYTEITEFHPFTFGQRFRDVIQSFLDYVEDIALDKTSFIADGDDKVTFG